MNNPACAIPFKSHKTITLYQITAGEIKMKETLYTIPLTDAFNEADECPFCNIERKLERDALDFILGSQSAYMQSDIREQTNKLGFCKTHYKDMFQYGNSLGNAIMLKSYFEELNKSFQKKIGNSPTPKASFLSKFKKKNSNDEQPESGSINSWITKRAEDCFVCNKQKETYKRYIENFFYLIENDEEFYKLVKKSKGFCLPHFGQLTDMAATKLSSRKSEDFYKDITAIMIENMNRVQEDLDWFVAKFDYRNHDADWKNSKDAVQRAMQKLNGGYPADGYYKSK